MSSEKTALQVIAGTAKCPQYSAAQIQSLMERLDVNNKGFALLMNVTPATVRLWLTGAARPCSTTCRLMQIFDVCPDAVNKIAVKAAVSEAGE